MKCVLNHVRTKLQIEHLSPQRPKAQEKMLKSSLNINGEFELGGKNENDKGRKNESYLIDIFACITSSHRLFHSMFICQRMIVKLVIKERISEISYTNEHDRACCTSKRGCTGISNLLVWRWPTDTKDKLGIASQ